MNRHEWIGAYGTRYMVDRQQHDEGINADTEQPAGEEVLAAEILRLAEEVERCREVHREDASRYAAVLKERDEIASDRTMAWQARDHLAQEVERLKAYRDLGRITGETAERARLRPLLERCLEVIGDLETWSDAGGAPESLLADLRRELGHPTPPPV